MSQPAHHNQTYVHTQTGLLTFFFIFIAIVGLLFGISTAQRMSQRPVPMLALTLPVLAMLTVIGLIFSRLTISVESGRVMWWFEMGVGRKSEALSAVVSAVPVRNPWFYGWGIRYTPVGWLYNVSGLDAVEVTLASGKRFRLGTNEPEMLARAIMAAPRL